MSEGMGTLSDPASMSIEELRIRADEARRLISSVEMRTEFLDHYPSVKKLYREATEAVEKRIALYERLIEEKEGARA